MATIVLQAAGAFLGGALGPVGSAIGSAVGAMAGYALDRSLIESTRRIEGPRLGTARPFVAEEGAALARVYGTVRIGGNLIWATRFEETRQTERQGAKGGPKVTTYSYFCNAAFALCEGEIAGVRRIWADGRELDLEQVTVRVFDGGEGQAVDPLIGAKQGEGNTPAYRGVAYAVFDRFPLNDYGNRIPQFQFEVMRPAGRLRNRIRAVTLLPGSTEYGLLPRPVTRMRKPGETEQVNRHALHGASDLVASLDELQALCPELQDVAIVVTWFGDDLRAGQCRIRPAVTDSDPSGYSEPWQVAGVARLDAATVSVVDGAAAYGGTPSDHSVVECIKEIRARGLRATLYPFVMMDIAPGNSLPNPYGGIGQPAFPWRGRITCDPAPGEPASADKSIAARSQVEAFAGAAAGADFATEGEEVTYSGDADDWGYRRLVLHYAHLAVAAGGVDAFLLGSEMRGLTTLRDGADAFPFVETLTDLAAEVRAVLGPEMAITYGADWSEYFGHQPGDGSGDVFFHLDALWSHEAVTAVGIDNYMPLSDWRDADYAGGNPDGFREPYDAEGLRSQVAGGEGFDWYYADMAARLQRQRTPITDGAYGKPWVFRYKDIAGWWSNEHFNRVAGVEAGVPTAWQPQSKPVWFTELGCPAVDKGPNQPNVFPDAKSSENAAPYFSSGGRSDIAQGRFLAAHTDHWDPASPLHEPSDNPVSVVYGGRMVDPGRLYVWSWDARPFPAFPLQQDIWKDGDNWHLGHWLNGRLSSVATGDLIEAILADHGIGDVDGSRIGGSVAGYIIDNPSTARAALDPIIDLFGVAVEDVNGALVFRDEAAGGAPTGIAELIVDEREPVCERMRIPENQLLGEAELGYLDPLRNYQSAIARTVRAGRDGGRTHAFGFPGCLEQGAAGAALADWLKRKWAGRETVGFLLPPAAMDVTPGSLVTLPGSSAEFVVAQVEAGLVRRVSARRVFRSAPASWPAGLPVPASSATAIAGAPHAVFIDLPMTPGANAAEDQFRIAAYASPWKTQAAYSSPEETGFVLSASIGAPATIGVLTAPLGSGVEGRLDHGGAIAVELYSGELASVSTLQLMNGANTAAIRAANGAWEVLQFADAEEIAPSVWRLTGLLRGQLGTGDAMAAGAAAGASLVLLDGSVAKAGLAADQIGLALHWRVGPIGHDFSGSDHVQFIETGGVRARLPLAPVHLKVERAGGGDAEISWIRRGRIDADSWVADDIPLGEENERYRVEVAPAGGAIVRSAEAAEPRWTYPAAQVAADFGGVATEIDVTVRQISASAGGGLSAVRRFLLA